MKQRIIAVLFVVCLVLGALALLFPLNTQTPLDKYSGTFFGTFDTVVTLIGFAPSQDVFDARLADVRAMFESDHQLFDLYHAYDGVNNLYTLNQRAATEPVAVDQALFDLLKWCKDRQTLDHSAAVNIAMGGVLGLWHDFRDSVETDLEHATPPSAERLQTLANHSDIANLILDEANRTVYYADPYLKLDLGAVAKGYAAERAAQYLLSSDMPSFILSAGGNVRAGNPPKDGRLRWGVGVQDPDGNVFGDGDLMDTLYLSDGSVVTSGDYQRYVTLDGTRYHHLISPETLQPADYFRAVTIVTEDSLYADYLSTELFLIPYEQGRALVDSLPGVEALWVLPDRTVKMTAGMEKLAKSMGATSK